MSGKTKYPLKSHLKEGGEKPPWSLWEEGVWVSREGLGTSEKGLGLELRLASGLKRSSLYLQNSEFRTEVATVRMGYKITWGEPGKGPATPSTCCDWRQSFDNSSPPPCLASQGLREKTVVGRA